jgi:hypothetical protein
MAPKVTHRKIKYMVDTVYSVVKESKVTSHTATYKLQVVRAGLARAKAKGETRSKRKFQRREKEEQTLSVFFFFSDRVCSNT